MNSRFYLPYDKLVLAVGTKSHTFGTPGFESREEMIESGGVKLILTIVKKKDTKKPFELF